MTFVHYRTGNLPYSLFFVNFFFFNTKSFIKSIPKNGDLKAVVCNYVFVIFAKIVTMI